MNAATRKEKLAWAGFDFANSSFTTVIITVVYAKVFTGSIVPADEAGNPQFWGWHGDSWWAFAQVISQVAVLLTAPLVGTLADRLASKKRFLFISALVCVVSTASLVIPQQGQVLFAWLLVVVANFAFSTGENLVGGFLPELADQEEMGRLSALGWTIGYFGGLAALVLSLGLVNTGWVRWVPLGVAAFFALSALPTFLFLRERAQPRQSTQGLLRESFGELRKTWGERHRWRDLFRFLWSILFFQAGVAVVVAFSAIYGTEVIGLTDGGIIRLFIALQIAAAAGAWLFGQIQDRVGSLPALSGSILVWILAVILAWLSQGPELYVVSGILAGLAMGGSQCASRALVGLFCPKGREGEWFGLWGLATKAAAVLGLLFYSLQIQFLGGDRRTAILATGLLFAAGLVLLLRVDMKRGMAAAQEV